MNEQSLERQAQSTAWSVDPRWQLVERICETADFRRAPRLAEILRYLTVALLENREATLREQDIGVALFGRAVEYDSSNDSIVRSNVLRLRKRLENYFQHEGCNEPLRLDIPVGSYVLHFSPRETASSECPAPLPSTEEMRLGPEEFDPHQAPASLHFQWVDRRAIISFLVGLAFAVVLFFALHNLPIFGTALSAGATSPRRTPIEERFWNSLFSSNERTIVVPGDSVLIFYETLTRHEVTLAEYTNGLYLNPAALAASPSLSAMQLNFHRYTSVVDLNLTVRLSHLPQWSSERSSIVFARDLRPAAAADSNLILIGSEESNPWVSLVGSSMNFALTSDGKGAFFFTNRHPKDGEANTFNAHEAKDGIGASISYGDIAYLPNPSGRGMVLVLSGQWMSGAQAAGDFVLNGPGFSAWLKSIENPDGSIPSFEILTASRSVENNAIDSSIVAKRVYGKQGQ
jgi:hypothetical protein